MKIINRITNDYREIESSGNHPKGSTNLIRTCYNAGHRNFRRVRVLDWSTQYYREGSPLFRHGQSLTKSQVVFYVLCNLQIPLELLGLTRIPFTSALIEPFLLQVIRMPGGISERAFLFRILTKPALYRNKIASRSSIGPLSENLPSLKGLILI